MNIEENKKELAELFEKDCDNYQMVSHALFYEQSTYVLDDIPEFYSYEVKCVDSHGGEGQGEDFYSVFSFTKDGMTVYAKFSGSYYSYNGAEYERWFFVTPVERMVTFYEEKT